MNRLKLPARAIGLVSIAVVAVILGACSAPKMSPPPLSMRTDSAYQSAIPAALRDGTQRILYATDRRSRDGKPPKSRYSAGRAHTLTLGAATVRFGGEDWSWEQLAQRSGEAGDVPMALLDLEEFGVLPSTVRRRLGEEQKEVVDGAPVFAAALDKMLEESGEPTVTVFVHGFNTSFPWAVNIGSSLWHLGARKGAVIIYSWPSHNNALNYPQDRESGAITARALRELLLMIAEETSAERINLLTYSAGAPTVVGALHQMRLIFADEEPVEIRRTTKLDQVVFSGADVDRDLLATAMLDRMQDVAERITIYTSRIDLGVGLSNLFFFDQPRLGRAERSLSPEARLELRDLAEINVVDVTYAQNRAGRGDLWAHAYWYGNAWVSNDLLTLLLTGAGPTDRGLQQAENSGVWTFPKDYPQRVAEGAGTFVASDTEDQP